MLIYPNANDVIAIHDVLVQIYKEEDYPTKILEGINYLGNIQYVCNQAIRIKKNGAPLYPHILQKAANYLYYLNIFHPFTDGNKRTSLLMTSFFLRWNGYRLDIPEDTASFLIDIADPTKNKKLNDAYDWILKNTKRTVFDVFRHCVMTLFLGNVDESTVFHNLLDIYTYEPIPYYIKSLLSGKRT